MFFRKNKSKKKSKAKNKAKSKEKARPREKAKGAGKAKAEGKRRITKVVLPAVAGSLAVLVLVIGLVFVRDWAFEGAFEPIREVRLEDKPVWMDDETAEGICEQVSELAGENPSDPGLPAKAAALLAQNIWVKRVATAGVVNNSEGTLIIRCDFRKPLAAVSTGPVLVRVDEGGLVLPGELARTAVPVGKYKEIVGVTSDPPQAGQVWGSDDLQAGVAVLRLIEGRAFGGEITAVDVNNYNGRRNVSRPHIVLKTAQQGVLYWGRAIGSEGRIEVDYHKKLEHLEGLFLRYGSLNKLVYADLRGRTVLGKSRSGEAIDGQ